MGQLSVEKISVPGVDGDYEDFDMPEGAIVLASHQTLDWLVLYVAVPVKEETAG